MENSPAKTILLACFVLIAFLAFGRALDAPFFWDDKALILYNPYLGRFIGLVKFFSPEYWQQGLFPKDFRPIEMYSYSFDYLFWRRNPIGYHLTNILIHIFNCFSVYLFLSLLFKKKGTPILASMLFALHPIHSEAVIWIQNRSDLLAASFSLVSIIAFVSYIKNTRRSGLLPAISSISFALAFLTKESAITVPILCASTLLLIKTAVKRRARLIFIQLVSIAAAFFLIKFLFLKQGRAEEALPYIFGGWFSSFFSVTKTMAIYLSMLVLPVNFSVDRCFSIPLPQLAISPLLYSSAIIAVIVFAIRAAVRRSAVGFASLFIFISLLPICNIVFLAGRPISEQRLYFASIGFCLLLASIIKGLPMQPRPRRLLVILILVLSLSYLLTSIKRTDCWRDEQVLWERTLEVSPSSWRSELFLATIYREQERFEESIALLKHILRTVSPRPARTFKELGLTYGKMQWHRRSLREFERAIALEPDYLEARLCLGDALKKEGRYGEAIEHYSFVEQRWPLLGEGQLRLGILYKEQERYPEALDKFEQVLEFYPENTRALINIASIYNAQGRYNDAEDLYKRAIELDPRSAMAHNDYGLYLERHGRYDAAIRQYKKSMSITPDKILPHYNLAQVYIKTGKKGPALLELMRAAQLQPDRTDIFEEINRLSDELEKEPLSGRLLSDIFLENCELLNRRGVFCGKTGNDREAIGCFQKLIALQPNNGQAHANLGQIYAKHGDYKQALEEFLVASSLLPGEASIFSSLGSCYAELGRMSDARRAWEKAIELNPHAKEARRNLSRLRKLE